MKRFALSLLVGTAAFAVANAASAADLIISEPMMPAAYVDVGGDYWSGAYVGAHVGYGWGVVDWTNEEFALDQSYDIEGWLAGVQAGYNMNLDGIVLGVEGDVAWSDISGVDFVDLGPGIDVEGNIGWLGTIRGRVGFAADAFLIYGTGGVAFAGTNSSLSADGGDFDYGSDSATHVGWVVGAGVEAMVADNVSIKAEYLYHDFGSQDYTFEGDDSGDIGGPIESSASFNVSTVKVGVNFHF